VSDFATRFGGAFAGTMPSYGADGVITMPGDFVLNGDALGLGKAVEWTNPALEADKLLDGAKGQIKNLGASLDGGATAPAAANQTPTGTASPDGVGGGLSSYFYRAVVIILGFIFVAVGLSMFGGSKALIEKVTR
jgi:hypothetical protein